LTPQGQENCLTSRLSQLPNGLGATSANNFSIAKTERIDSNPSNSRIKKCIDSPPYVGLNVDAVGSQTPWNNYLNGNPVINLPESNTGIPFVLDSNAPGSMASLGANALNDLANCTDPTTSAIAKTCKNLRTNGSSYQGKPYSALVSALWGDEIIRALGFSESDCRDFVINHERAHLVMDDRSQHAVAGDARFDQMFSDNGVPNPDGLGLLMTLANKGASQANCLGNIINQLNGELLAADTTEQPRIRTVISRLRAAQGVFNC
jgi:hypothetical protein